MGKFQYTILTIGMAVLVASCSDDDDPLTVDDASENIESQLRPFIKKFVEEGEERGHFFDFDGFEATFSEEEIGDNEDICGRASSFSDNRNTIVIRLNDNCWIDQPGTTRQALVFHELGHSLLDRPHRDDRFDNGLVKSIMETGMLGPYNEFTPLLRTYLVDELFDETTPDPEWASGKTEELEIGINGDFEVSDSDWQFDLSENTLFASASGERTNEFAASGDYSLKLENSQSGEATAFWRSQLSVNGIPETADIEIEVKIRMQSVQGAGVAIIGALVKRREILTIATTERDLELTGTSDFETYKLIIPHYPNTTATITILLALLPETSGVVYFDDIKIKAVYNPAFGPV
jgi:hypothetical protein